MPNINRARELLLEQMYGRIMYRQALNAYTHVYDAAFHSTSEADKALKLELAEETLATFCACILRPTAGRATLFIASRSEVIVYEEA